MRRQRESVSSLHVDALYDMWAFGELIKFKSGMHTFSQGLHRDLVKFVTTPQIEANPDPSSRRRLTLISREHRKSTINTVLYTMWRLYRNPDLRIAVGCNEKRLSESFIRELRFYFEDEELQETVWNNRPHITGRMIPLMYKGSKARVHDDTSAADRKVVWNQRSLQVVRLHKVYKEPSVEAVSVNVSLTGSHYDIVILDDIVDWDNSSTPAKAKNVENWAEDLESVLIKKPYKAQITPHFEEWCGDEMIINGTPYYRHDYYHSHFLGKNFEFGINHDELETNLEDKQYIAFIKNIYNNNIDSSDGYTFPEEFNDAIIKRLMSRTKRHRFMAQFLLTVVPEEEKTLTITKDNIVYIMEKDIIKCNGGLIEYVKNSFETIRVQLYMVVDLAGTTNKSSDNSSICVGGKDWDNNVYIVDMLGKKLTPSQLITEIFRIAHKWDLRAVYVERGNYQGTFAGSLRSAFSQENAKILTILTYYFGSSKKERITNSLEPLFTNRMLHTFSWIVNKTPFGMELEFHPSESVTDDCIDTAATLNEIAQRTSPQSHEERRAKRAQLAINRKYGGVR